MKLADGTRTMEIIYDKKDPDLFPKRFVIIFENSLISFTRVKNDVFNPIGSPDIYTVDENQKVTKYNLNQGNQVKPFLNPESSIRFF